MNSTQVMEYLNQNSGAVIRYYETCKYAILCLGREEVSRMRSNVWAEVSGKVRQVGSESGGDIRLFVS